MLEQYVYNKITEDPTLQALLLASGQPKSGGVISGFGTLINAGSGYINGSIVPITGGSGHGATTLIEADENGVILNIYIQDGGVFFVDGETVNIGDGEGQANIQASEIIGGVADYFLYPDVIPRGVDGFDQAVTFTTILTTDVFPASRSSNVQFNIFSKKHSDAVAVCQALSDLFNEDNNNKDEDSKVEVVFSMRKSESDLGFNYDDNLFQREATYYFKLR